MTLFKTGNILIEEGKPTIYNYPFPVKPVLSKNLKFFRSYKQRLYLKGYGDVFRTDYGRH